MRFSILLHVPLLVPMTGFIPGKERAIIKRTFNFLERIPLQVPAAAFDFNLSKSVPRKCHSDISNNCAYVCRIYIYILSKLSRLEWKRIEIWPQDFNNFLKTIPALLILSNLSNLWRFPACQTGFSDNFRRITRRRTDDTFYLRVYASISTGDPTRRGRGEDKWRTYDEVSCSLSYRLRSKDASLIRRWWNWRTWWKPVAKLPRSPAMRCYANLFTDSIYEVGQPCKPSC